MWLVTGGAGYIGSHIVKTMLDQSFEVLVLDNLLLGLKSRLDGRSTFVEGDICDHSFVRDLLRDFKVEGIINLAALKSVEESEIFPEEYLRVNHLGVRNLIECAKSSKVNFFIQSSSAAVYGNSKSRSVNESSPLSAISPYGQTKVAAESEVNSFVSDGHGRGVSLRYFNVLGSANANLRDNSKKNIVPMVLANLDAGIPPVIFGADYATKDGTCIRDYVHVSDVARAHLMAVEALQKGTLPTAVNIGTGIGYSVREVIDEIILQRKSPLQPEISGRRTGDPEELVAEVNLAREVLGFVAEKSLSEMIRSAI
jgi:UDP-glucose 4-epimerase